MQLPIIVNPSWRLEHGVAYSSLTTTSPSRLVVQMLTGHVMMMCIHVDLVFIDQKEGEIIHLVASVCLSELSHLNGLTYDLDIRHDLEG